MFEFLLLIHNGLIHCSDSINPNPSMSRIDIENLKSDSDATLLEEDETRDPTSIKNSQNLRNLKNLGENENLEQAKIGFSIEDIFDEEIDETGRNGTIEKIEVLKKDDFKMIEENISKIQEEMVKMKNSYGKIQKFLGDIQTFSENFKKSISSLLSSDEDSSSSKEGKVDCQNCNCEEDTKSKLDTVDSSKREEERVRNE